MSDQYLALLVADVVGALTLWLVARDGGTYPWAWSLGAWAATAALGTGLVPVATVIPIAAMAMILGVGLITPLVGVIAVLVILATPVVVAQQLWGRWRRRARASIAARAAGPALRR
jgi:hypothetical protein